MQAKHKFSIALHGGAGTILKHLMSPALEQEHILALKVALDSGSRLLKEGASALDAVEASVRSLEDCPLFNAGRGSVFNHEGKHEMDAAIMEGTLGKAGAVCGVSGVKNPVSLARNVMEKSPHVLLCGEGAIRFALEQNLPLESEEYFFNQVRYDQWKEAKAEQNILLDHSSSNSDKKFGTVGAVALDMNGNLAAATSTGGMTNKQWGRIGDSPIIGAGTWASQESCAVSCTGHGEYFMRAVVAHDIHCLMYYKGLTLHAATDLLVHDKLKRSGGEGGLIAIDKLGNIAMPFNSEGMYRACCSQDGQEQILIYKS
ncbi:MAG: isoaspartyl peptidase/L-asparaginase [Bacteroidetes bacterium]|nr:isoaspartyl peptidase/L-asparaginase [Bacteroidota bacterium]